jgi:hypothetical protein
VGRGNCSSVATTRVIDLQESNQRSSAKMDGLPIWMQLRTPTRVLGHNGESLGGIVALFMTFQALDRRGGDVDMSYDGTAFLALKVAQAAECPSKSRCSPGVSGASDTVLTQNAVMLSEIRADVHRDAWA